MIDSNTQPVWANDRLRLVVTAACNINCFYCHNEGQPKANQFLSDSLFYRINELIQKTPPKSVTFTGGEALLHPQLEKFAKAIKVHCSSVTVVSNGILLDNEKLQLLANAGITKIRLGVDSFAGGKSRPSSGAFPKINALQRIIAIRDAGIDLELNIVLTKFNLQEMPEIFRLCSKYKISAKVFEHVEVEQFGTATKSAEIRQKPIVEFAEFETHLKTSGILFRTTEANGFHGANFVLDAPDFSWRYCRYLCPFGLCYMTGTRIDATGTVYACMEKRFTQLLSTSDTLDSMREKLRRVTARGCCR